METQATRATLGHKILAIIMSIVLVVGLSPTFTSPQSAYADDDLQAAQVDLTAQDDPSDADQAAADKVDELIEKIQSQTFTPTTYADCEAAKAAWDALTDTQKELVEEADYFGRDTGDASKDDPLNQDEIGENEILVVSFGTSFNDSRVATIGGVEKALKAAYPDWSVRRAFTAQIIINHVYARDGEKIDNVTQAMDRAVANGVKNLVVQPTHLMHGAEYDELKAEIDKYADKMAITYAEPLLGEVGASATDVNADKTLVAGALTEAAVKDAGYTDIKAAREANVAFVFIGHGTSHVANVTYSQMQTAMDKLGFTNVFVGTVEGEPEGTECEAIIAKVKAAGYKNVVLRPMMVVAGDHANNDMADLEDPDSWASQFTADTAFTKVDCQIAGLGQIPAIQQLYVAHTTDALANAEPFAYTGDVVTTIKADGTGFGMFTPQEGTKAVLNGDKVKITYFPKNKTIYKGFYLNADKDVKATWLPENFVEFDADGNFTLTVDKSNCGKALPIAPVKKSDGGTTADQYYLAIPAADKLITPVELAITNNVTMFKASAATAEKNADGSATLVVELNGTGYQNLFKGTYAQAAANGANTENWIKGHLNEGGKWEFEIPISASEVGTDVPVVSISQSYYDKYLKGENPIERAFFPRMFNVNLAKATLIVNDYAATKTINVTKKPGLMMSLMPTSTLVTVGGPNSNEFDGKLILAMDSSSYSKAFVGSAEDAEKAAAEDIVEFNKTDKTFTLTVQKMVEKGKPETAINLANGEPFIASFFSEKNQQWYERALQLDENACTLYVSDAKQAREVDELIAKIQVQERTATTDADCIAAKDAWDALDDAQKGVVEEADYFGLDTGDASKDDPLNQDGIGENEILVVSFGTSFNDSRVATIGGVEKALKATYPDWSVRRAFTAQIIINHVQARDGEKIDNVTQAMDRAVANGVKNLVVQPTHLMHGAEYDELKAEIDKYAEKMNIVYAEPLLGEVGASATDVNADKLAVGEAVVAAACADAKYADAAAAAADGTAIVLMGHGTSHVANITYEQMQTVMNKLGYGNVFIGTVEGEPASTECSVVIGKVKAAGYKKVILRPLMVVAGDHANNDMADPEDEESWYSQFKAAGAFDQIDCQIAGLGQIPAIQQLYVDHTNAVLPKAAIDAPAAAKKLVYNGKEQTGVQAGKGYTLSGTTSATNAGKYKATAKLNGGFTWSDGTTADKTINWSIAKAKAKAKVTGKKTYKASALKKKAKSFQAVKVTTDGKVAYKSVKVSNKKQITFKNGKVTVKKGTPAGKYTVKGKVTAKAGKNYKKLKAQAFKVTITVK